MSFLQGRWPSCRPMRRVRALLMKTPASEILHLYAAAHRCTEKAGPRIAPSSEQEFSLNGNLTRLLRDGKPLKFFVVPEERMKEFAVEGNARGLLFVPVKDKTKEDGKIEIAVWAEDAAKVNRVLEKMKLDYVQADTGSKADVVTAISEKVMGTHRKQKKSF